jgi:hypothetical protein
VVYCGGLENRFRWSIATVLKTAGKPGGSNPSLSASLSLEERGRAEEFEKICENDFNVNNWIIGIGWSSSAGVLATCGGRGSFSALFRLLSGNAEELKKCTWPTWEELKGSTVVVMHFHRPARRFHRVVDFGDFFGHHSFIV